MENAMKALTIGATLALATAAASAPAAAPEAGWQRVAALKGHCEMYVPADWKADEYIKSSLHSADNSASAVISSSQAFSSMAELKPGIERMFPPTKAFEDSAQRLWYQYTNAGTGTNWYVAVPAPGGSCTMQITYKNASSEAVAKKIALSLAPSR
jgi:hypothetical protein